MKKRIIYLMTIVFVIFISLLFNNLTVKKERYHQHLEAQQPEETTSNNEGGFSSHLPIMEVVTDGEVPSPYLGDRVDVEERNYENISAEIHYYDQEAKENLLTDLPTFSEKADFRIRGRSSRTFDKKGYLVKFKKEDTIKNKKIALSGMTADSEWALHGPYLDKTLIRNYLSYNLAGEMMDYSPNVRFMELFLNGDYQGLYLLTEKIEQNKDGRINITETDPKLAMTSYILALDSGSEDPMNNLNTFNNYAGQYGPKNRESKRLEVTYPNKTLTVDQKEYIENEISLLEKSLISYDSADRNLGFPAFLDMDSFVDYFIFNEFTMNSDAGRLSTYFYKDIRGKIKTAVWDFNSAFNSYRIDFSSPHYFMMMEKNWFRHLIRDQEFVEKIIKRYRKLRETVLSDDYILNYIDETVAYLGPAIERNNELWGYSFKEEYDFLNGEERNPRSYEEAVEQLKEIVVERGSYMDKNIETLRALSHDSVNKVFRERSGG